MVSLVPSGTGEAEHEVVMVEWGQVRLRRGSVNLAPHFFVGDRR